MKLVDLIGLGVLAVVGYAIFKHAPLHNVIEGLEPAEHGHMGHEVEPDVQMLGTGGPPNRRNDKQFNVPGQMLHSDGYVY